MSWATWVGWGFAAVSTIVALVNRNDAAKYRRLDRPWVVLSGGSIKDTCRNIQVRIANDDKGAWEIIGASVASPGHARVATTGSYDDDGYGGSIPKPGDWKQNLTIDRWNGTLHVTPANEPARILFTLRSRADPSQTLTSGVEISAPHH